MGLVGASTIHAFKRDLVAGLAPYRAGGGGASASPDKVRDCAPPASGRVGALVAVATKGMAIVTLRLGVETQAALSSVCGGEGRQAPANEVRGSWTCHGNDHF